MKRFLAAAALLFLSATVAFSQSLGTSVSGTGGGGGGGSGCTVSGVAGIVLNNGANGCATDTNAQLSSGALSLGSSSVPGSASFGNLTSGTITIQPVAGALGSVTLSLPAATDQLVGRATVDTLSNKTLVAPALGTPVSGVATNITGLPVATGISGFGTGVATALGDNVGSAGAFVVNGGALGTPSSGVATNITGLPLSTGISGFGTGVATALGDNIGSAGAPVVFNGALGTPSSGVATNITGLPVSSGISGLGTGVATALGAAVSGTGSICLSSGSACGGGGGSISITDGTTTVNSVTQLTCANSIVSGTTPNATCTPTNKTTIHTISATAANIGGQDDYNNSALTATLSTLNAGQTNVITNQLTGNLIVGLAGQTAAGVPVPTVLHKGGFYSFSGVGSGNLDTFGFPGYDTITSGALVRYSATDASGALDTGNLSGDCTTSGSLATVCLKTNGVSFGTAATQNTGTSGASLPFLNGTNTWSGPQTFGAVYGSENDQAGTTYTLAATDCGKTVAFSSGSTVTVTIAASIVPAAGTDCNIAIRQDGAGQVAVNGSAVSAATLVSAHSYTKTFGQHAVIGLSLTTIGATTTAVLTGDGA